MSVKEVSMSRKPTYCSFCGKPDHEVSRVICGPAVGACNECIDLMYGMIHDPPEPPPTLEQRIKALRAAPGYPWLPCPICRGTEGCDHTVPERQAAHARSHQEPGS